MWPKLRKTKLAQLIDEKRWDDAREKLQEPLSSVENELKKVDSSGLTLLGFSVIQDAPIDVVERITALSPDVLPSRTMARNSPLHLSCKSGASINLVQIILQKYPKSVVECDRKGQTSLHHVVRAIRSQSLLKEEKNISLDVVKFIYKAAPQCVHELDENDETPLDEALKINECHPIRNLLLDVLGYSPQDDLEKFQQRNKKIFKKEIIEIFFDSEDVVSRGLNDSNKICSASGQDISYLKELMDWRRAQVSKRNLSNTSAIKILTPPAI